MPIGLVPWEFCRTWESWTKRDVGAYLAVRLYSYDDTTPETYETARSVLAGLRWKF